MKCDKCGTENGRDGFYPATWERKRRGGWGWCRGCLAAKHPKATPCDCPSCLWFTSHVPLNRWRIQACQRLGISATGAKAVDVAAALAKLYGDPPPKCSGGAFAYMAEKYDDGVR